MILYRSRTASCAMIIAMLLLTAGALAATPTVINYQGRLSDAFGNPVPDSDFSITFTIYDAEAGGNSKWSETQPVTTTGGMFAVLLGSVNPITDSVFNDTTRYLGMQVGADPEMSPRTVIASVPYSFRASMADAAESSESAQYADSADAITDGGIDLSDIGQNGAVSGQVIKWNGTVWEAATDSTGSDSAGWNWSDSSSHGPDSVKYADSSSHSSTAGSAAVSDSTDAITDGGIDFSDIGQNGAASGQVIKWNGSAWEAATDATGGGGAGWNWSDSSSFGPDSVSRAEQLIMPATLFGDTSSGALAVINTGSGPGLYGANSGAGTNSIGIQGWGANASSQSIGIDGAAFTVNGGAYGVRGKARGPSINYGVYGEASYYTTINTNYGLYGIAKNGNANYGIYATADSGATNWAAYFEGDTKVTGDLSITSGALSNSSILFEDVAQNGATSGQVMKWNGSAWAAGDVLGSGSIQFSQIAQNGASSGQVMKWNGSAWAAADDAGGLVEAGSGLSKDTTGGLVTLSIANSGVKSSMIAYQAVTSTNLGISSVSGPHISNRSILAEDIGADVITAAEIATGGVTTTEIADQTITDADISGSAAIHKSKIAGTAMTLSDLQVVTADKYFQGALVVGSTAKEGYAFKARSDQSGGVANATARIVNVNPTGVALSVENNSISDYVTHMTNLAVGPIMRCENPSGPVLTVGRRGTRMYGYDGWWAAEFYGNVAIRANDGYGTMLVELGEGLDYAEGFDVSEADKIEPGAVLSIDPAHPGELCLSSEAYDRKVAGIVAGARQLGSGVRLGADQFDHDVALAGRVYCNVDASFGAIQPGDLLTTSPTPGHAMVVQDHSKAQGAILGKAMEPMKAGEKGQILVLVTLQ